VVHPKSYNRLPRRFCLNTHNLIGITYILTSPKKNVKHFFRLFSAKQTQNSNKKTALLYAQQSSFLIIELY